MIYELIIETTYGFTIKLQTDEIDDCVKEILNQLWVVNYQIKEVEKSDYKKLIKKN